VTTADQEAARWYLRRPDGKVYGPVPLSTLRLWAEQCRVSPDSEISSDGTSWLQPSSLPDLELEWILQLAHGRLYGPVNFHAVKELLGDGRITPDIRVFRMHTKQSIAAGELTADIAKTMLLNGAVPDHDLKGKFERAQAEAEAVRTELNSCRLALSQQQKQFENEKAEFNSQLKRAQDETRQARDALRHKAEEKLSSKLISANEQLPDNEPKITTKEGEWLCPSCGCKYATRLNRKLWMRMIPWSKRLSCDGCGYDQISVAGVLKVRIRK